VTVSTSDL